MASVTPSPSPGYFLTSQNISFAFDATVVGVSSTVNGAPPSISKYIAYDTLVPPNPFIAITQDGRGNVVYDGGFPKFYNGNAPVLGTTFANLSAAFKYLYNAINFCANQTKVAAGNKKILILGDSIASESYPIKSTAANGFFTSFTNLCNIVGFTPTFKDRSNYTGSQLDARLAELEGYALVLLMSSGYDGVDRITNQCVNDIVTFRENGNGLILITDHGPVLNNIAEATANMSGFFATANQIAVKFGAYFTGDYNRTPVNVGFLRSTYGDHPLYANLTNAESISAGGSESKVVVTNSTITPKANFGNITVSANGLNSVQLLVTKTDGSIETYRWVYSIQGSEFVFNKSVNPTNSQTETNTGKVYADLGGHFNMDVTLDGSTLGTIWGEILNNEGKRIGEVYYDSTIGNKVYWYAGAQGNTPLNNGDIVTTQIRIPFDYSKTSLVQRTQPQVSNSIRLPDLIKELKNKLNLTSFSTKSLAETIALIDTFLPANQRGNKLNVAKNFNLIRKFFNNEIQNGTLNANIYDNVTQVNAAIAAAGTAVPGKVFINAELNTVYAYKSGAYVIIANLKAKDIFGSPRVVTNPTSLKNYTINTDNTIVLMS